MFSLQSSYQPAWDQPEAIQSILHAYQQGQNKITLLGATGTGKTFTMANVIQSLQKPTLIISHNKTLAAQLATEFKHFFPNNAVHYFVSYFDYYQPESYLPDKDIYIEKEATINAEIEMYRLSAMASLLTRPDTIIVSSVSALYGLGDKEFFYKYSLRLQVGQSIAHKELKSKLIAMRYESVKQTQEQGTFDVRWDMRDIYPSTEKVLYRLHFTDDHLDLIEKRDALTWEPLGTPDHIWLWPWSQYMQDMSDIKDILIQIEAEMVTRVHELKAQGKLVEAQRLEKRTMYDIRMIKETGFVNGIENYSMYFEKRDRWATPQTIFDYFPDDMLLIMDESHMSIPQLQSMPAADKTRKKSLIDHGFRLPSASEHRPLSFHEVEEKMWRQTPWVHTKKDAKSLFVSATPSAYELTISTSLAEQVIRPTGLLDPITTIYPKSGDYWLLMKNIALSIQNKPHITHYLNGYGHDHLKEVFTHDEPSE